MLKIFTPLLLISSLGFTQNRETSVALQIEYGVYSYFEDSLGMKQIDEKSDCDCVYIISSTFWTFISNKEKKSPTLDEDILNWIDEDQFVNKIEQINRDEISKFKGFSNTVHLTVDIKRKRIIFNPLHFNWIVRYDYDITIYLDPKETKRNF